MSTTRKADQLQIATLGLVTRTRVEGRVRTPRPGQDRSPAAEDIRPDAAGRPADPADQKTPHKRGGATEPSFAPPWPTKTELPGRGPLRTATFPLVARTRAEGQLEAPQVRPALMPRRRRQGPAARPPSRNSPARPIPVPPFPPRRPPANFAAPGPDPEAAGPLSWGLGPGNLRPVPGEPAPRPASHDPRRGAVLSGAGHRSYADSRRSGARSGGCITCGR